MGRGLSLYKALKVYSSTVIYDKPHGLSWDPSVRQHSTFYNFFSLTPWTLSQQWAKDPWQGCLSDVLVGAKIPGHSTL